MRFHAVIFDLDDTIHDKSATLKWVGKRLHVDHQLDQLGVDLDAWLSNFVALNNLRIEKAEVFRRLRVLHSLSESKTTDLLADNDANLGRHAVAFPRAIECLEHCKAAGLRLGLVTNGRDHFQRSKLEGMGVTPLFDVILTSDAFGLKKPDPAMFEACPRLLGAHPKQTAVVGDDRCCDIDPGLALGMTAIWKSSKVSADVALCTDDFNLIEAYLLAD